MVEIAAKMVSELFMLVLCMYAAPAESKEICIDVIGDQGYTETLVLRKESGKHDDKSLDMRSIDQCTHPKGTAYGFAICDEIKKGKLARFGTIRPVKGSKHLYVCTHAKRKPNKETVDLGESVPEFESLDLREADKMVVELKNGAKIHVHRSGSVVYLTPEGQHRTYVVHLKEYAKAAHAAD